MTVPVHASIVTHFQTLEDPRIARRRSVTCSIFSSSLCVLC